MRIKNYNRLTSALLVAALAVAAASCDGKDDPDTKISKDDPDTKISAGVYVVGPVLLSGEKQEVAILWKDGVQQRLPSGAGNETEPHAVFVTDNTVYVAGSEEEDDDAAEKETALLWKNGEKQVLENETKSARALSVFVSGSNEYVAGYARDASNRRKAVLWTNGKKELLQSDSTVSVANAVFVSGSDVYVAGYEDNYQGSVSTAVLWKNGVRQTLPGDNAEAYSVYVAGSDVYVAGYAKSSNSSYTCAVLWKNSVKQELTDGTNYAYAYSVYVSGNDVYVAGQEEKKNENSSPAVAAVWKISGGTTTKTTLGDGQLNSRARSVYVLGSDVYAAGSTSSVDDHTEATLWKNGEKQVLSTDESRAYSVFVKQ